MIMISEFVIFGKLTELFLAVHNSSIGDLVTNSLIHFYFCQTESNPRHLPPLRQIFGGFSDFWKIFRFLKNFRFLEDFQIFGRFLDIWQIFRFLEDFQIFGQS